MTTDLLQDLKDSIVLESERIVERCREIRAENDRLHAELAELRERLARAKTRDRCPHCSAPPEGRTPWTFYFTDEQLEQVLEALGDGSELERADLLAEICGAFASIRREE